jgi:hypothetical protein
MRRKGDTIHAIQPANAALVLRRRRGIPVALRSMGLAAGRRRFDLRRLYSHGKGSSPSMGKCSFLFDVFFNIPLYGCFANIIVPTADKYAKHAMQE